MGPVRRRSSLLRLEEKIVQCSYRKAIKEQINPWKKGEAEIVAQLPHLRERVKDQNGVICVNPVTILPNGGGQEQEQEQEGPRRSSRVPKRKRRDSSPETVTDVQFNSNPNGGGSGSPEREQLQTKNVVERITSYDYFKGKEDFGSAIVVLVEGEDKEEGIRNLNPQVGWLQCGVCQWFGQVLESSQHKKYGAFICMKCVGFLNKVMRVAKKAEGLRDCPTGGSCTFEIQEGDQDQEFCEGCFVRSCLGLLDLSDDIYFKLWRAVPPEVKKDDLPFAPPKEKRFQYSRGKVLLINCQDGNVINELAVLGNGKRATNGSHKKSKLDPYVCSIDDNETQKILQKRGALQPQNRNMGAGGRKKSKTVKQEMTGAVTESKNAPSSLDQPGGKHVPQKVAQVQPFPSTAADLSDKVISEHGYPVTVIEGGEPPSPLCFSCGSAGVNQLVFCCTCFQPFHPYCSEDSVLLATYLNILSSGDYRDLSKVRHRFRKWKCHRCLACKRCGCGKEKDANFIGCAVCMSAFHIKCAKNMPLKPGDRDRDRWVCAGCIKCSSCHIALPRVHTRQILNDPDTNQFEILCMECLRGRQKGSFCPVCLSCYDDDDWDSKMMQCDKCKRWIHSRCEILNDERYFALGTLPETIPYICRICSPPMDIGWRLAIETEIREGCMRVLELFHKKALGITRKRKSLLPDLQRTIPDAGNETGHDRTPDPYNPENTMIQIKSVHRKLCFDSVPVNLSELCPEGTLIDRYNIRPCIVRVVALDFRKIMNNNFDKLGIPMAVVECENGIKVEVECSTPICYPEVSLPKIEPLVFESTKIDTKMNMDMDYDCGTERLASLTTPTKPEFTVLENNAIDTPLKMNTPNRIITSFTTAVKTGCTVVASIKEFRCLCLSLLPQYLQELHQSGNYEGDEAKFIEHFDDTLIQVFPWWKDDLKEIDKKDKDGDNEEITAAEEDEIQTKLVNEESLSQSLVFHQVLWDKKHFLDTRRCVLCEEVGDFPPRSCGRLLYASPEEWVHVNCTLWSSEVWEDENGCLQQVEAAISRGLRSACASCTKFGATLNCCAGTCRLQYHFLCSQDSGCILQVNKGLFCPQHSGQAKGHVQISDMQVTRKVFIPGIYANNSKRKLPCYASNKLKLFVGSARIEELGYLVPISALDCTHKLLLPVNISILNLRLLVPEEEGGNGYSVDCWHTELNTSGDFRDKDFIFEPSSIHFVIDHTKRKDLQQKLQRLEAFRSWTLTARRYVDEFMMEWMPAYTRPLSATRRLKGKGPSVNENSDVQDDERKVCRAVLEWRPSINTEKNSVLIAHALSHPRLRFLVEQLPGAETIGDSYQFAFCPPPCSEEDIPATPTATGSARTEPFKSRRPYDMFNWLRSKHRARPVFQSNSVSEDLGRTKGLPMAMRFRGLRERATKDLIVLPSKIHGRGLFARRDFEQGEMLIEYSGELIRSSLCDVRERKYEKAGIGCYMFRVNRDLVVDATMKGSAARFINHSCDPNCESKAVKILGKDHILIFALRSIKCAEELTYDYKFEREIDDKLPCSCSSRKCRQYLN